MPNGDPQDGIFYLTLTLMMDSYIVCLFLMFYVPVNELSWVEPVLSSGYSVLAKDKTAFDSADGESN